jgi:hypothetical protein
MDARMNYMSKLKMTLKSDNPEGFKSFVSEVLRNKREEALANAVKDALVRANLQAAAAPVLPVPRGGLFGYFGNA